MCTAYHDCDNRGNSWWGVIRERKSYNLQRCVVDRSGVGELVRRLHTRLTSFQLISLVNGISK